MTQPPDPAAAVVDAMLAETGWTDHGPHEGHSYCEARVATAARQAAAVLRALAAHAISGRRVPWWTVADLTGLADRLDPDDPPPADTTEDLDPDELEAGRG